MINKIKETNLKDYIENKIGRQLKKVGTNTYKYDQCPLCHNGDHFTVNDKDNLWNTWGNCGAGSLVDFYMSYYNVEIGQAVKELASELNLNNLNFEKSPQEVISKPKLEENKKNEINLTQTVQDYYISKNNNCSYFLKRGITEDNILNHYCLCCGDPLEVLKEYKEYIPQLNNITAYEYIIPIWENKKIVSVILRRNDDKSTENTKTLNLKGIELKMVNMEYLKTESNLFLTEGIFDCLSLETLGCKSICLNSVNMSNRFIESVKKEKSFHGNTLILALDNDKQGKETAKKIYKELKDIVNIKFFNFPCETQCKDINELYLNDMELFEKIIESYKIQSGNEYSIKNNVTQYLRCIDLNRSKTTIKTQFEGLNQQLGGGLYPGLYCLGAISALGKTAFLLQLADYLSIHHNVLFFSLEMPFEEVISRNISRFCFEIDKGKYRDISTAKVLKGEIDLKDFTEKTNLYFESKDLLSIIEGDFNTGIDDIEKNIVDYISKNKVKPIVFIDYLQILKPRIEWEKIKNSNGDITLREKYLSDKQSIDNITKALKIISKKYRLTIIVVSSLNRASYGTPLSHSCFKESGCIEYTSDVLMGLQYSCLDDFVAKEAPQKLKEAQIKESKSGIREVTLVLLKQRNGKSYAKQKFYFYPANNYFMEVPNKTIHSFKKGDDNNDK